MDGRSSESTLALFGSLARETGHLLDKTFALARLELGGNLRAALGLIALFGGAGLLLVAALFTGLHAAVKAVAALVGSEAIAALVVATPFVLAAALLATFGLRRMALANLEPRRTERQVAEDAKALLRSGP